MGFFCRWADKDCDGCGRCGGVWVQPCPGCGRQGYEVQYMLGQVWVGCDGCIGLVYV